MLQLDTNLCGQCGGCVAVCSIGALELFSSGMMIKNKLCNLCENCVVFCPVGALKIKIINPKTASFSQTKISDQGNG
jgi:ferredoxin